MLEMVSMRILFSLLSSAIANACNSSTIELPINDVQVSPLDPDSLIHGIPATVGTPPQNIVLLPWAELNNTWLYDDQKFCNQTFIYSDEICNIRRGSVFRESQSQSFSQAPNIAGARGAVTETQDTRGTSYGIENLTELSVAGTDVLNLASTGLLNGFPLGIPRAAWDSGYTTLHSLGLGSNSTYLNALKASGRIATRAWSVYWGRMWTNNKPMNGSVIIGGYDRRKTVGSNYTMPLDYGPSGCWTGLKVDITDIKVSIATGADVSILTANTTIPSCIVPHRQLLAEIPGICHDNFEKITNTFNIGLSYGLHWSSFVYKASAAFTGDITIKLSTGLEVRVQNDQYIIPHVNYYLNGSRFSNYDEKDLLIHTVDSQIATLGRYFLTAAYLMVNYDAGTFSLWQANPSSDKDVVPILDSKLVVNCTLEANNGSHSGRDNSSTSSLPSGLPISGVIWIVIGAMLFLSITIYAVVFYLKRHRAKVREAAAPMAPVGSMRYYYDIRPYTLSEKGMPIQKIELDDFERKQVHFRKLRRSVYKADAAPFQKTNHRVIKQPPQVDSGGGWI